MKFIKNIVWKFLNFLGIGGIIQLKINSALKEEGWFKSFETKTAIDIDGKPLAWYSYSFLRFLKPLLNADFDVFEYGAGNSTLWYATMVKSVKSVENDKKWVEILTPKLPNNAIVVFKEVNENKDYQTEIKAENKKYDIIVLDGRRRNDCAMLSVDYLTDRGVIILDNSNREDYQPAKDYFKIKGFRCVDFWGILPIVAGNNCTSVYYKNDNCLGI